MKLAKVIVLSGGVEVIVKKVIEDNEFSFTLTFMAEMEDKSLANTVLTLGYNDEKTRNKDFEKMDTELVTKMAETLPIFKDLITKI